MSGFSYAEDLPIVVAKKVILPPLFPRMKRNLRRRLLSVAPTTSPRKITRFIDQVRSCISRDDMVDFKAGLAVPALMKWESTVRAWCVIR